MDGFTLVLWAVRLLFLALLYLFLARVIRVLLRDLKAAAREPTERPGRLVVLDSPAGEPEVGRSFGLDVITSLGRDVNNAIVIDDPFASAEHAVLTRVCFRGGSVGEWRVLRMQTLAGRYWRTEKFTKLRPLVCITQASTDPALCIPCLSAPMKPSAWLPC